MQTPGMGEDNKSSGRKWLGSLPWALTKVTKGKEKDRKLDPSLCTTQSAKQLLTTPCIAPRAAIARVMGWNLPAGVASG